MDATSFIENLKKDVKADLDALGKAFPDDKGIQTIYETFKVETDEINRIIFNCGLAFNIIDVSPNLRMMLGLYNWDGNALKSKFVYDKDKPDKIDHATISLKSKGFYLSTPFWYLVANVGEQCYTTQFGNKIIGNRIMM